MECTDVRPVDGADIGLLISRLEQFGPQTAQVRCFLQLLEQGINNLQHWVFASPEQPGHTPVVLGMTLSLPDLLVVEAFSEDSPAGCERLEAALLTSPAADVLWHPGRSLRTDSWAVYQRPSLERAAAARGFTVTPISASRHLFIRETDPRLAPTPHRPWDDSENENSVPTGVKVGPLSARHMSRVLQYWPYLQYVPDGADIIRRSVEVGLTGGVFLSRTGVVADGEADGEPEAVSWILMNTAGKQLGFAHTLEEHRRRGFARLALRELARRCAARRLPLVVATGRDNVGMLGAMRPLGFTSLWEVFWSSVTPKQPPS